MLRGLLFFKYFFNFFLRTNNLPLFADKGILLSDKVRLYRKGFLLLVSARAGPGRVQV